MSRPNWVEDHPAWREKWDRPWLVELDGRADRGFKRALWDHGLLSPHFTRKEGGSHDGVAIPESLRVNAQRHALKLERVRRELGRPLSFIDLYRSPAHNAATGGVSSSEHLFADASDWGPQPDQAKFNEVTRRIFAAGGIGSGASSGNVQHLDDGAKNGGPRRWTYPGR